MKAKILFILITGFAFIMSSCESEKIPDYPYFGEFLESDLEKIQSLKGFIPTYIITAFEDHHKAWVDTWSRFLRQSDPSMYALSDEYFALVEYCSKYGKAVWPLAIEKLAKNNIFAINLIADLMCGEDRSFAERYFLKNKTQKGKPIIPSVFTVWKEYSKVILDKEYDNMLIAIRNISKKNIVQ